MASAMLLIMLPTPDAAGMRAVTRHCMAQLLNQLQSQRVLGITGILSLLSQEQERRKNAPAKSPVRLQVFLVLGELCKD